MATSGTEQIYFRLCSDHLSIEAIPRKRINVDLGKIKQSLPTRYELVMWTPHFAVVRNPSGQEITLRADGRMLIRKAESERTARQAAAEMLDLIQRDLGFGVKP